MYIYESEQTDIYICTYYTCYMYVPIYIKREREKEREKEREGGRSHVATRGGYTLGPYWNRILALPTSPLRVSECCEVSPKHARAAAEQEEEGEMHV